MQGICDTEIFPSALNVYWVFNLIILLAVSPQSSCLSSGSSCLALGLDKALGFRFLIKASCYPEVMAESWAQWSAFCHSLSWDTQISCSLASCEPVAGALPASSGSCCSPAACSWAKQFKVNPIKARLRFSPSPASTAMQAESKLQGSEEQGSLPGRRMLGWGCRADPGDTRARGEEELCSPQWAAAVQLSSVKHLVLIRTIFHIPIKKRRGLSGLLLWNMLLL